MGSFECVSRSFLEKDLVPLRPGETRTVNIVFEPLVYEVAAGHILRLTLAGADNDNFNSSSLMTVNSHIFLPRICMKYQNIYFD